MGSPFIQEAANQEYYNVTADPQPQSLNQQMSNVSSLSEMSFSFRAETPTPVSSPTPTSSPTPSVNSCTMPTAPPAPPSGADHSNDQQSQISERSAAAKTSSNSSAGDSSDDGRYENSSAFGLDGDYENSGIVRAKPRDVFYLLRRNTEEEDVEGIGDGEETGTEEEEDVDDEAAFMEDVRRLHISDSPTED